MIGFLDEARQDGRVEGRLAATAEAVVHVLESRRLALSSELRAKVLACTDQELLLEWLSCAATASTVDDLFGAHPSH